MDHNSEPTKLHVEHVRHTGFGSYHKPKHYVCLMFGVKRLMQH